MQFILIYLSTDQAWKIRGGGITLHTVKNKNGLFLFYGGGEGGGNCYCTCL